MVLADDHPLYRQGLATLLTEAGMDLVGEAANGPAAIEAVGELAPDVVLMDINMPAMSGVEATRVLTERFPASRVLILSVSAQEEDVTEAILAGAGGYVLKDAPLEELVTGIRAVAAGQSFMSPRVASVLLRRVRDKAPAAVVPLPSQLSDRELEVLRLVAQGMGNQEIAEALFIAPSTVRNHISGLLMKLQVDNRVQAAVRAVRERMV